MFLRFILLSLLSISLISCASSLETIEPEEVHLDLLHSDLPIFGHDDEYEIWPQSFMDEDSFGCVSKVPFGHWRFDYSSDDDPEWINVENHGVFHCWANVSKAYDREELESADSQPSFFIELGTERLNGLDQEIWVLQIGARPGSEYFLLTRNPNQEDNKTFDVLQRKCPTRNIRDAGSLGIIITRYCAINSKPEFIKFANSMAKLESAGKLTLVPN